MFICECVEVCDVENIDKKCVVFKGLCLENVDVLCVMFILVY